MSRLEPLTSSGVTVDTPEGLTTIRARIMMGIFDLPAKAAVLSSKQFNGEYGCSVCTHPGQRLSNGARVYLPQKYDDRTHTSVVAAARAAQRCNSAVEGVKGISPLAPYMDLVISIPIDYMHAVLEGVVRMLLKKWFLSANHREPYYLGRAADAIDDQLMKQHPPHEFSRPPRSIQKHMNYWKASELRSWLLYYSLPLLLNHLPPLYWHHYALLMCAIYLLLKDPVLPVEVDAAEQMLWDFYALLPELYGDKCCTANAHLLSHLTKYVCLWGPLWTHSSFGYENKNGHIKHLIHNKSDVVTQLLFNLDVTLTLQQLYPLLSEYESEDTQSFLDMGHLPQRANMMPLYDHVYSVGKIYRDALTEEQGAALQLEQGTTVHFFSRLFMDGALFSSMAYVTSEKKRNDTFCSFTTGSDLHFGRIEVFLASPMKYVLIRACDFKDESLMHQAGPPGRDILGTHSDVDVLNTIIRPFSGFSSLVAVPLSRLSGKAVVLYGTSCDYVMSQPNRWERH